MTNCANTEQDRLGSWGPWRSKQRWYAAVSALDRGEGKKIRMTADLIVSEPIRAPRDCAWCLSSFGEEDMIVWLEFDLADAQGDVEEGTWMQEAGWVHQACLSMVVGPPIRATEAG